MILLTGATGFLGREIFQALLRCDEPQNIAVLIRGSRRETAQMRFEKLVKESSLGLLDNAHRHTLQVFEGDLGVPQFALSDYEYQSLFSETTSVIHCAASTSFSLSAKQASLANVFSTEHVLDFCRHALKAKLAGCSLLHVSTAYVAGETAETVSAAELDLSRPFRNTYEQSKAEAEYRVRLASEEIHTTIVRPSIVVGNSQTGATSAFNVIYGPAKLLVRGLYPVLPGHAATPFDVVPVDYVVRAIMELAGKPRPSGRCYHLCAGEGRESTLRELIELLLRAFQNYLCRQGRLRGAEALVIPELVNLAFTSWSMASETLKKIERKLVGRFESLGHILHFLPYLHSNPRFDVGCINSELSNILPPPPLFREYAHQIFEYCFATNWGKRRLIAA